MAPAIMGMMGGGGGGQKGPSALERANMASIPGAPPPAAAGPAQAAGPAGLMGGTYQAPGLFSAEAWAPKTAPVAPKDPYTMGSPNGYGLF